MSDGTKDPDHRHTPERLEVGDYYRSPEGYIVFTEQYHLKRGICCENGCRHCPFGFHDKKGKGKLG